MSSSKHEPLRDFAAGVIGGLVGLVAMRYYWKLASAVHGEDPRALTLDDGPDTLDDISIAGQNYEEGEASTAAVGRIAYETATGDDPSDELKGKLSYGVHYGYGLTMAGLYGAVRGRADAPDLSGGMAFGTALWVFGDELMTPLLGLAKGPTAYPPLQHAHRLGAHLAFGLATAAATQTLQRLTHRAPSRSTVAWDALKTYATWKAARKAVRLVFGRHPALRAQKTIHRAARTTRRTGRTLFRDTRKMYEAARKAL